MAAAVKRPMLHTWDAEASGMFPVFYPPLFPPTPPLLLLPPLLLSLLSPPPLLWMLLLLLPQAAAAAGVHVVTSYCSVLALCLLVLLLALTL